MATQTGTVKFFNSERGFGFITREGKKDLFVHFSEIETGTEGGFRELRADDVVEFEEKQGRKGPEASRVRVITRRDTSV